MTDVFGTSQRVLVYGGASEIGRGIITALRAHDPALRCVYACRTAGTLLGPADHMVPYDATDPAAAAAALVAADSWLGGIDLVIIAAGVLPDERASVEVLAAAAAVNYVGAVAATETACRYFAGRGGGTVALLSSIAAVRVRASMPVYGSSKAAADAHFRAVVESYAKMGVRGVLVRPGFVHTKLTAGRQATGPASTPATVGASVARAVRTLHAAGVHVVYTSFILSCIARVLPFLPRAIVARLDRNDTDTPQQSV